MSYLVRTLNQFKSLDEIGDTIVATRTDRPIYVRDVANGTELPDVIDRTRFAALAWRPGKRAFFYTRYPAPGSVPAGEERLHRRVYEHRLGDAPERDVQRGDRVALGR